MTKIRLLDLIAISKGLLPESVDDWAATIVVIIVAILACLAIRDNRVKMEAIRKKYCNTKTVDKP